MFKRIAIVFLVLLFAFGGFGYLSRVSERRWGLIEGQMLFKSAELEVTEYGYVTNHGAESRVWLSSNVVSIGGTQYQCFLETTNHWFQDEGILAVTTNHELIWLDSKRPPKIIPANYVPPIFPPRF
jgi:hypothetical protein